MRYYYPAMPKRIHILPDEMFNGYWTAEVKMNGWRCMVYRDEEKVQLWTRHKTIINDPLPNLRAALLRLPPNTIIDGELVDKRTKGTKELYYAFDILRHRNVPLFNYNWLDRRTILEQVLRPVEGLIMLSEPSFRNKVKLYQESIGSDEMEGLVLKHIGSTYPVGLQSCPLHPEWYKLKKPEKHQRTEGI